jgi:hypothetical protein
MLRLERAGLWTAVGVYLLILLALLIVYNALAGRDPQTRWQLRIMAAARLLGCYDVLAGGGAGEE